MGSVNSQSGLPVEPSPLEQPLFCGTVGQERALAILKRALESGPAHAYLFTGPSGVGKQEAAFDFAAAICCEQRGCGSCPVCRRVREGIHPDVEVVSPDGTFITVDQIREINRDVALRPFEARARVILIFEAEAMNEPAANAFLKTLEEPPAHAHFVLVTDHPEQLLETIVSRCQRVPFSQVPAGPLADHLRERYTLSDVQAMAFARVSGGNLEQARRLATSEAAREHREQLLSWARQVPEGGLHAVHITVDDMLAAIEAQAEERVRELEQGRERDLDWAADARSRARVERLYDQRIRRERRRAVADGVEEALDTFTGWYRDLAFVALGAEAAVRNHDFLYELRNEAFPGMIDSYLEAVRIVKRAQDRFRYNVDTRSILEDMILGMKEALLS
ncbi:MAG: hypothetical protein Kow00129_00890 [Thermoleophilia bacterium]